MSDSEVNNQYKEGEIQQAAAKSRARSNVRRNLREELLKQLAEKTRGTFADRPLPPKK